MENRGFAIVEILIIIVVIGSIAAVVLSSYKTSLPITTDNKTTNESLVGITLKSELTNIANQLRIDQASSADGQYPATLNQANDSKGITFRPDIDYEYIVNNDTDPKTYCVTATQKTVSYMVTNDSTPAEGTCD